MHSSIPVWEPKRLYPAPPYGHRSLRFNSINYKNEVPSYPCLP
jgi:hypothetical protein